MAATNRWKKGRGKLGIFAPLLGSWHAEGDSPVGPGTFSRTFTRVLDNSYIQLNVHWAFRDKTYDELALIGVNRDGTVTFWSFTSDGKHSEGILADVRDIHPEAIGFEADMPAGRGRMVYWPDEIEGMHWVVESKTRQGWNRFVHHHYRKA